MSPLQEKLLEQMEWLHDFCKKNSIQYYALGGTMLGIVRHQGFIPWDDDIDVGMPRPDYEKFLSLTEGKIIDHYTSETYRSGNLDFMVPFAKLYDINTTLVEMGRIPLKRGIFIDIFPLDGVSEKLSFRIAYKRFRFDKNFFSVLTADAKSQRSIVKKCIVFSTYTLPNPICNRLRRILLKRMDSFCQSIPYNESNIVANLMGSRKEKEPMGKKYFGRPTLYQFEHIKIYGVEKPHEYLRWLIGSDYMTPPPEEQRVGHNLMEYDLSLGYYAINN